MDGHCCCGGRDGRHPIEWRECPACRPVAHLTPCGGGASNLAAFRLRNRRKRGRNRRGSSQPHRSPGLSRSAGSRLTVECACGASARHGSGPACLGAGRTRADRSGFHPCARASRIRDRTLPTDRCSHSSTDRRALGGGGGAQCRPAGRRRDRGMSASARLHSHAAARDARARRERHMLPGAHRTARMDVRIERRAASLARGASPQRSRFIRSEGDGNTPLAPGAYESTGSAARSLGGGGRVR